MRPAPGSPLSELAWLFLRLGTTSFGGPAAHIAMLQQEAVERRGWLTQEQFLDLVSATNLIPGPNSTEMAIHLGYLRGGAPGLVVAGCCFILPAALLTTGLAWAYLRYGSLPQVEAFLYGVKPVIIAVVVQALWGLGRSAIKSRGLALLGLVTLGLVWLGVNEILLLLAAGALVAASRRRFHASPASFVPFAFQAGTAPGAVAFGLGPLFLFFVKVGCLLFGSGYVLLAFLRSDLVERWHWLTNQQLLDAVAAGQVTPGPVFTTATFIGYLLGGGPGALVATLAIFLPAFVFVAISGPLVPRLRRSPTAGAFLDGVNVASLALMVVVSWYLGRAALVDGCAVALACLSLFLLLRYRTPSLGLILGGALVGLGKMLWLR